MPDNSNSNLISGTASAGIVIFSRRQGFFISPLFFSPANSASPSTFVPKTVKWLRREKSLLWSQWPARLKRVFVFVRPGKQLGSYTGVSLLPQMHRWRSSPMLAFHREDLDIKATRERAAARWAW